LIEFAGFDYWLPSNKLFTTTISGITAPAPGTNTPQSINFPTIDNRVYGGGYYLNAQASSGLPITYTSLTPTVCVILYPTAGPAVQSQPNVTGDGVNCTVQASQPGDDRYAPAQSVSRSFTYGRAPMKITITNPVTSRVGAGPHQLIASTLFVDMTGNSGLLSIGHLLTVVSNTPAVCSVNSASILDKTGGLFTQAFIKGITNGTCQTTWRFEGTGTRAPASTVHSFTLTGLK
jgi:hypothetical protein